ncbi:MAG: hypothetical protein ACXVDJ_01865 [Tumebacillaceae bacterium]
MAHLQVNQSVQVRTSVGKNLMTMVFGMWLIAGVFIDGFAHNHGVVETFFTPWHAILYSGFLATAAWIMCVIFQNKRTAGLSWLQSIPQGYGIGTVGIFVFLLGGLGDMWWHTVFGIEKNVSALLSPTHLILLLGALMILSSPFRVGWNDSKLNEPSWKQFLPTLLSIELTTAAVAFFLMYAWNFRHNLASQQNVDWVTAYAPHLIEAEANRGLMEILLDTILMMYPVFLMMRRWKTPFGTFAFHMTFLATTMAVLDGFMNWQVILVMLAGGLVADVLFHSLKPGPGRMWVYRVIALAVPVVIWGLYFLGMAIIAGIGWPPELWCGSIVEAALVSLGLCLLGLPPERETA